MIDNNKNNTLLTRSLRPLYLLAGAGLGLVCLVTALELVMGSGVLLALMERYVSDDGTVAVPVKRYLQVLMISGWLLLVLAHAWRHHPSLGQWPAPGRPWLWLVVGAMCVVYMAYRSGLLALPPFIYEEDGIFENLTALLMLVGAALAATAAWRSRATGPSQPGFTFGCLLVAVCLFLLAMEEISWGQRIFGWASPQYFAEHNDQQETNVHNFFNDAIWLAYQLFATVIATLMLWGERPWLRQALDGVATGLCGLLPAPRYVYFGVVFVLVANYNELFEEVFALFSVLYGRGLLMRSA